jgi:hypothetical protein
MSPQEQTPTTTTNKKNKRNTTSPTTKPPVAPLVFCSDFTSSLGTNRNIVKTTTTHISASTSVHVVVTKDVPALNQQKWLEMANELASETWKEPGCVSYDFVRSKQDDKSSRFVIIEEVRPCPAALYCCMMSRIGQLVF